VTFSTSVENVVITNSEPYAASGVTEYYLKKLSKHRPIVI